MYAYMYTHMHTCMCHSPKLPYSPILNSKITSPIRLP